MNSQHRPALASRLTRRWVRMYTAHLDPARRDTRRAELASDLWEHQADAQRMGLVCRVRGHHYVTKRLPNRLGDGGTYCVCERCNHRSCHPADLPPIGCLDSVPEHNPTIRRVTARVEPGPFQ